MSCSYQNYYNNYYRCSPWGWGLNYCNPCKKNCCNPCPPIIACPVACPATCPNICPPPCPPPCPEPCTTVAYANTIPTTQSIPSGGGSGSLLAGLIIPLSGYSTTPITNIGGINLITSTSHFIIPVAGRYTISANIGFSTNTGTVNTDVRQIFIYQVSAATGETTLLASKVLPVGSTTATTYVSTSTTNCFNINDQIYIAATQTSSNLLPVSTTPDSQMSITRLC